MAKVLWRQAERALHQGLLPGYVTLEETAYVLRAGPIGVYAEIGDWQPPNWVFNGVTPAQYLKQAITWADHRA